MIQQWDFPVDEPVSLADWRHTRPSTDLSAIAARLAAGQPLRTVAAGHGVSHETLRRALRRDGVGPIPRRAAPAVPLRRARAQRLPGRGRSQALAPEELPDLISRHRRGESMRSLARSTGVSHETMRRALQPPA